MKIIVVFVLLFVISCKMEEINRERCFDYCINNLLEKMDDSSFSQNQFNQFDSIVEYCIEKKKKYKCYDFNGLFLPRWGYEIEADK